MYSWWTILDLTCLAAVVSGEAPEQPVVSIKSGNLFERRLIEKYITDHGKDPINSEVMTVEDLIEVKSSK
jgi:pre-mRNA-processing factor 19